MTSHQFSANKKAAVYDFRIALKNIIIPTVLTFISSMIIFVISPISTVFSYYFEEKLNIENLRKEIILALTATHSGEYIGLYLLFLGALFAIISFGFIMSKKTVNVFLSTSIDRRTLYKNRALAAVLMIAAAIAIPIFADMLINIFFIGNAGYVIRCALALFAEAFIYTFTGFAIMAVAMTLCSTIIEALFFGAAAVGMPSVAVYFVDSFCTAFLKGYYHNDLFSYNYTSFAQPSLFHYTSIINPLLIGKAYGEQYGIGDNIFNFAYRVNHIDDWMSTGTIYNGYKELSIDYILPIIVWAAISVGLIFIARKLFIKFKAENAGVHGANTFAQHFYAVICVIAACAFWVDTVRFVCNDLSSAANTAITILTSLLIILGMYTFIISVCKRTIKHKANEFIAPLSVILGVIVFTCIISTGAFGYSTYIPETDEIDKAIITTNVIDTTTSEFTNIPSKDSYYDDIFSNYYSGESALGVFDNEEDLKVFTDINKELIEETDNMTGNAVCVYYILKNGKTISRYYESTDYDASYRILSLRDSKTVKEELSYLLSGNIKDAPMSKKIESTNNIQTLFGYTDELSAANVFQGGKVYTVASDGFMNGNIIKNTPELRQALLTDLLSQTYEQRYKPSETAIGGLFFSSCYYEGTANCDYSSTKEALLEEELGADVYYSSFEGGFYIYPSMTNTVNYLKSTGEYNLFAPQEDEILSISIEKCSTIRDKQFELWGSNALVSHHFVTFNQFFTNIDDFNEDELDDYEINQDAYDDYHYTKPMTYYFKDGVTVNDNDKIAELMAKSRNYYYSDNDDYVIMANYKDAGYVSYLIPANELPDWAIK